MVNTLLTVTRFTQLELQVTLLVQVFTLTRLVQVFAQFTRLGQAPWHLGNIPFRGMISFVSESTTH